MSSAAQPLVWNFNLLSHHELNGFGGMGEGMAMQAARDGRRILWMAHESAPKNFTAVDVTDPRNPKLVAQTDLPQSHMRSNSLEVTGDLMAVAYQVNKHGLQPAGFELFDISVPENPRSIVFVDCSAPHSRGVHQLWFCDGEYVHLAGGAPDFVPRNRKDDQCYRIFDVRNPSKPTEVGRWWLPGVAEGDDAPPPVRHTRGGADVGFRAHNTNVYPQRPDRAYIGYVDGGMIILDIADKSRPKMVSRWDNSPPFDGFTHTVLPLFDRDLLVVTDEAIRENGSDLPKLIWIVDNRDETNPTPIATCPSPTAEAFTGQGRGARVGAHNIHENVPQPTSWQSDQIVVGTFFNAGLRAYDISNPYQPKEVGHFVPPAPPLSPTGFISLNDVFIDERAIVYTVDRQVGGLYTLEMEF
ncbi:MAG: LVIVD repeat-containing protein [Alphaproteobacteria bacterium]